MLSRYNLRIIIIDQLRKSDMTTDQVMKFLKKWDYSKDVPTKSELSALLKDVATGKKKYTTPTEECPIRRKITVWSLKPEYKVIKVIE